MEKEPSEQTTEKRQTLYNAVIETVKTAFMPVKNVPYVSHGVDGKKKEDKPDLKTGNNAFYIGKIMRRSISDRIKSVLKWKQDREPIYNDDLLTGALEYVFNNAGPDAKPTIVICRAFSEIFNGPKDVKNAISTEEQKELIHKIAFKKFGMGRDRLEVLNIEEIPMHKDLFASLRRASDADTGEFDPVAAFGDMNPIGTVAEKLSDNPSSLEIAKCIYRATLENQGFAMRLKKGITARLKESGHQELPTSYYSLTEIAVRLAELYRGQTIHGGVNRQAVYDEVIEGLIKGRKGPFKRVKALIPVFEKFEGKRFETLHLDNSKNPHYRRTQKRRALARLATAGIIGASTIAAPYGIHRYEQEREREIRQEMVREYIDSELRNVNYYMDGKWRVHVDSEKIDRLTENFLMELEPRYGISPETQEELHLDELFKQFLIQDKQLLVRACAEDKYFVIVFDRFIQRNKILLQSYGIEISRPYNNLTPYLEYILEAAEKDVPERSYNVEKGPCIPQNPLPCGTPEMKTLGIFYGHGLGAEGYELYLTEERGRKYLLAREYIDEGTRAKYGLKEDKIASTGKAQKAARLFVKAMKLYDIVGLMDWKEYFFNLSDQCKSCMNHVDESFEHEDEPYPFLTGDSRIYRDYFGAFSFELIEASCYDKPNDTSILTLEGREEGGEGNFSVEKAREAAGYFNQALNDEFY